jgi:hypothetical protein
MLIANPIYDVVFKYLMEDSKVAKLLIGAIIGTEIISLDFRPYEYSFDMDTPYRKPDEPNVPKPKMDETKPRLRLKDLMLAVYRLDFSAKIQTEEGEKIVIIEVQKAKLASDIVRFRKYLAKQYEREDNIIEKRTNNDKLIKVGLPIISIYFLGEELENIQKIPVLKVSNEIIDMYSGKKVQGTDYFIESLTHKSYIISIPDLSKKRRNELEMLLSVFDQDNKMHSNYILNVKEEDFPEKYQPIIRRLQKAGATQTIREKMEDEDTIIGEFLDYEHRMSEAEKKMELKDRELAKKDKALEDKNKALEDKNKALEDKDKALENLNQQLQTAQIKLETSVQKLWAKGMKTAEIADLLGVAESEVKEIVEKL